MVRIDRKLVLAGCLLSLFTAQRVSGWLPATHSPLRRRFSRPSSFWMQDPDREQPRGDEKNVWDRLLESTARSCQSAIISSLFAAVIVLFPTDFLHESTFSMLPPSTAAETLVTEKSSSAQANVIEDSSLPKPSVIGTVQDDATLDPIPSSQQEASVIDEVWALVDKYYIDRNSLQDWNEAREKYRKLISKAKGNQEKEIKLITEMVKSLDDKYSRVLDPKQYAAIQKFDLIGVGVTLMPSPGPDKDIIVGAPPIPGSAADKAGMKVGDIVSAVNGVPTKGRTAFDIIDQISEKPNANSVTMTVQSKDKSDTFEATMERAFLEVKNPIRYKMSETREDGTKVGFIRILEFNSLVKAKLEDALRELKAAGANAYVLDLRMNTGGAFQSAVEISSLFLEDRVATYVVDSGGTQLPFRTAKGQVAVDRNIPLVIWIDGTSASASEVLAGSLHDNCRAVLMGDKSFGKGLIQAVYGLKNGAGLVLTVARYVTPSGSDIQGVGIQPDINGAWIVPPPIPGFSTDTSKIDFSDVRSRLDPAACDAS